VSLACNFLVLAILAITLQLNVAQARNQRATRATVATTELRAGYEPRITVNSGVVLARITIEPGSQNLNFLIDTGCEITVMDTRTASMLHLPDGKAIAVETLTGESSNPTVEIKSLQIGSYQTKAMRIGVYDLGELTNTAGVEVDGVLGIDVLSQFSFTLEYERKKMTIWASGVVPSSVQTVRVPITPGDGGYLVPVSLNGNVDLQLLLDTGSNMTQLPSSVWQKLTTNWQPRKVLVGIDSTGVSSSHSFLARLSSVLVGEAVIDSPAVRFVGPTRAGTLSESDAHGLLGSDILCHFRVTIDIPHGQLFLERDPDFHQDPLEFTSIGIQYVTKNGNLFVKSVWKDSPAAQLHIQGGDQILEIQGMPAADLSGAKIEQLLRGPDGTKVKLKLRRGDKLVVISVPRRELL
jgi:predicted aspartyl protease